jgi:hypothetical protein
MRIGRHHEIREAISKAIREPGIGFIIFFTASHELTAGHEM